MTLEQKRQLLASGKSTPTVSDSRTDQQRLLETVGTFGYDAANSVLLGLPDFILRTASSDARKEIEKLRERNREASTAGELGGLVGSMFIPGGVIVRGLGAGAKLAGATNVATKLGKAADWLKGGELVGNLGQKIGTAALRGGVQTAKQAIPRALLSENIPQSLSELPTSIGVGALAGGILSPTVQKLFSKTKPSQVLREGIEEFAEKTKAATVGAMGIDRRAMIQTLNATLPGGARSSNRILSQTERIIDDIADIGSRPEYNFLRSTGRDKRIDAGLRKIGGEYEKTINKAMTNPNISKKAFNTIVDDIDEIERLNSVKFDPKNNPYTNVAGMVDDYLRKPDGASSLRNAMTERSRDLMKKGTRTDYEDAELKALQAGKAALDDVLDEVSELTGGATLKQLGREYKVLKTAQSGEFRDKLKDLAQKGLGSPTFEKAVIGSLIGGSGSLYGQGEEKDIGKTLMTAAIGGISGAAVNKLLPKLLQRGQASLAKPAEKLAEMVGKTNIGEMDAQGVPKVIGLLATEELKNKNPDQTIQAQEQSMPVEKVAEAKQEFSAKFASTMNQKMNEIYSKYYSNVDPNVFLQKVAEKTENFTNMREMANVLYLDKKQRDNFLRKYDAYLALKNLDIDKAIKGGGFLDLDTQAKAAQELLKNKLVELQSEGDIGKRETAKKQVEKYLADVKKNPELLDQFIKETGLDFADLSELGLVG